MLKIDRLRIRLPAGFEDRAETIARRTAAELAGSCPRLSGRFDGLEIGCVEVDRGAGDGAVASAVAVAIREGLEGGRGGES